MDKEDKPICKLFIGGSCPACLDDLDISEKEANEINKYWCDNSYIPSPEEIDEWYKQIDKVNKK